MRDDPPGHCRSVSALPAGQVPPRLRLTLLPVLGHVSPLSLQVSLVVALARGVDSRDRGFEPGGRLLSPDDGQLAGDDGLRIGGLGLGDRLGEGLAR